MRSVLLGSAILLGLTMPGPMTAPAGANDQLIVAVAPNSYSPKAVHIKAGETLTFANLDATSGAGHTLIHAVPGSRRRFESPVVAVGTAAKVPGIDKLPAGEYPFACRIHAIMKGMLVVE